VTKIIYIFLKNLVTPKARAKHEPFVQQTGLSLTIWILDEPANTIGMKILDYSKNNFIIFVQDSTMDRENSMMS
jgi:hypothetical protein